jgi:hypothetical protein
MQIEPEQWSTLSRLLDEALDIPINGLERWLDSLPPGDAMHRAKLRELCCNTRPPRPATSS